MASGGKFIMDKRIVFGFSRPRSKLAILGKLIMWAQGTKYSHVYIRFAWPAAKTDLIYQASKTKVNLESLSSFTQHAVIVAEAELSISSEKWSQVAQYVVQNLNKPYSFIQLLGMAYVVAASKLGIQVDQPFQNQHDAFICSELAADMYMKAMSVEQTLQTERMSPLDFYNFLSSQGPLVGKKV
jgi:hypothetical protein